MLISIIEEEGTQGYLAWCQVLESVVGLVIIF